MPKEDLYNYTRWWIDESISQYYRQEIEVTLEREL